MDDDDDDDVKTKKYNHTNTHMRKNVNYIENDCLNRFQFCTLNIRIHFFVKI
jgi:hypothetical protein